MNTSTEHILQGNQSEPLADASGRIVDLMNENWCDRAVDHSLVRYVILAISVAKIDFIVFMASLGVK